jgi:LPS export ABC transporter protein LptC
MEKVLNKKIRINLYLIIILCGVILLLFLHSGCSGKKNDSAEQHKEQSSSIQSPSADGKPVSEENAEQQNKAVELKKTQLQSRDGNHKIWSLQANKVSYDEKGMTARAEEIIAEFFDENDNLILTLKALGAVADLNEQSLKFEGSVTARTPDGDELFVNELKWDGTKKKLLGDKFVRIVRNDVVMSGLKMIADPDLQQVELSGNVRMTYPDMQNFLNF